jgi:hypothetical protein
MGNKVVHPVLHNPDGTPSNKFQMALMHAFVKHDKDGDGYAVLFMMICGDSRRRECGIHCS